MTERVWIQGKCGNCARPTDQLPCPYCAQPPTPGNVTQGVTAPKNQERGRDA